MLISPPLKFLILYERFQVRIITILSEGAMETGKENCASVAMPDNSLPQQGELAQMFSAGAKTIKTHKCVRSRPASNS